MGAKKAVVAAENKRRYLCFFGRISFSVASGYERVGTIGYLLSLSIAAALGDVRPYASE